MHVTKVKFYIIKNYKTLNIYNIFQLSSTNFEHERKRERNRREENMFKIRNETNNQKIIIKYIHIGLINILELFNNKQCICIV